VGDARACKHSPFQGALVVIEKRTTVPVRSAVGFVARPGVTQMTLSDSTDSHTEALEHDRS